MANVAINSLSEFRKKVSITYEFIAAAHHEAGIVTGKQIGRAHV